MSPPFRLRILQMSLFDVYYHELDMAGPLAVRGRSVIYLNTRDDKLYVPHIVGGAIDEYYVVHLDLPGWVNIFRDAASIEITDDYTSGMGVDDASALVIEQAPGSTFSAVIHQRDGTSTNFHNAEKVTIHDGSNYADWSNFTDGGMTLGLDNCLLIDGSRLELNTRSVRFRSNSTSTMFCAPDFTTPAGTTGYGWNWVWEQRGLWRNTDDGLRMVISGHAADAIVIGSDNMPILDDQTFLIHYPPPNDLSNRTAKLFTVDGEQPLLTNAHSVTRWDGTKQLSIRVQKSGTGMKVALIEGGYFRGYTPDALSGVTWFNSGSLMAHTATELKTQDILRYWNGFIDNVVPTGGGDGGGHGASGCSVVSQFATVSIPIIKLATPPFLGQTSDIDVSLLSSTSMVIWEYVTTTGIDMVQYTIPSKFITGDAADTRIVFSTNSPTPMQYSDFEVATTLVIAYTAVQMPAVATPGQMLINVIATDPDSQNARWRIHKEINNAWSTTYGFMYVHRYRLDFSGAVVNCDNGSGGSPSGVYRFDIQRSSSGQATVNNTTVTIRRELSTAVMYVPDALFGGDTSDLIRAMTINVVGVADVFNNASATKLCIVTQPVAVADVISVLPPPTTHGLALYMSQPGTVMKLFAVIDGVWVGYDSTFPKVFASHSMDNPLDFTALNTSCLISSEGGGATPGEHVAWECESGNDVSRTTDTQYLSEGGNQVLYEAPTGKEAIVAYTLRNTSVDVAILNMTVSLGTEHASLISQATLPTSGITTGYTLVTSGQLLKLFSVAGTVTTTLTIWERDA